jgi:hypothetical protein
MPRQTSSETANRKVRVLLALLRQNSKPSGICEDVAFGSIAPFSTVCQTLPVYPINGHRLRSLHADRASGATGWIERNPAHKSAAVINHRSSRPPVLRIRHRDPKGGVRCATAKSRRPMSELGHTCPVIGWTVSSGWMGNTGSSPRRGIVCKDYTAAPGEASAGSARLPPLGAGVY